MSYAICFLENALATAFTVYMLCLKGSSCVPPLHANLVLQAIKNWRRRRPGNEATTVERGYYCRIKGSGCVLPNLAGNGAA